MGRNLQHTAVSPGYALQLQLALVQFVRWVRIHKQINLYKQRKPSVQMLNTYLVEYVQSLYESKRSVAAATHTVLAVQQKFPHANRQLQRAWTSVRSWKSELAIALRPPLPHIYLQIYVTAALVKGLFSDRRNAHVWLPFAALLHVGFHGMMRPIELDHMLRGHVVLPSSLLLQDAEQMIITVPHPKNRRFGGRVQHRLIKDKIAIQWLSWLCADLSPQAKVFPFTRATMRILFKDLNQQLQLQACHFAPSSLRPGGATHLYLLGVPIDVIKFRGGWTALNSLEHYIQEAVAVRCLSAVSGSHETALKAIYDLFPSGALPPPLHWSRYFVRPQSVHKSELLQRKSQPLQQPKHMC